MSATSLTSLADELLAAAVASEHGRAARTVTGGSDHALRQTVMALREGSELAEHTAPGDATLQVLRGRVLLTHGDSAQEGAVGDLLPIPKERHALTALEDAVVVLTVAVR